VPVDRHPWVGYWPTNQDSVVRVSEYWSSSVQTLTDYSVAQFLSAFIAVSASILVL